MVDYEIITIEPKLKSQLKQKGKRTWFTLRDENDRVITCYNKNLFPGITVGSKVKVRIGKGKSLILADIIGFEYPHPSPISNPPPNKSEKDLFQLMTENGWELTKKGWPDFACFKDGKLVLIEVKPKRSHKLKYWQHKILLELVKHDIKCYRWSPDGGFEPIMESVKFPINLP